jgi:hypothetical protein
MLGSHVDALPVVLADGTPLGILTSIDLVGLIANGAGCANGQPAGR